MNTTRPPPLQGNPPSYAFVTRVYRRSLRPVIIVIALLSAIWTLLWSISLFQEVGLDQDQHEHKLSIMAIVLGAMYLAIAVIGFFGVLAASLQRLFLIRLYVMATVIAAVLVVAAGIMRVVVHFVFKNDLITECTNLSTGATVDYRSGIWGPYSETQLTQPEAQSFCDNAWSHDSAGEIISLLIEIVMAALFCSISVSYYRQMLDPTSVVNSSRAPSSQYRGGAFPARYNPPYSTSVPELAYDAPYGHPAPAYAPPPGAPPKAYGGLGGKDGYDSDHDEEFDPARLPGYTPGDAKYGAGDSKTDLKDPFADFEAPSLSARRDGAPGEERDVTSRPRPGEREGFNV
ncbi:hypothetical protein JAAARDRAFT_36036 [Jaapia argillacea MUCL 33604]|uniref:Uncharacterized protein n=1 Tax=Jaapia argillacea MUCL 33604 TaxID=933084 RepID=A0A067PZ64_9AGAM|nr:hypothetical protein JAAARDRAFT_36036 [Jaapia argillacea MUCL 33604]